MTRNRVDAEPTDGYANTAAASLVRAKAGSGFVKWYLLAFLLFFSSNVLGFPNFVLLI
jgi:hypothetical protein